MRCRAITNVEIRGHEIRAGTEFETDPITYEKLRVRGAVEPVEIELDFKHAPIVTEAPAAVINIEPQPVVSKKFSFKRKR